MTDDPSALVDSLQPFFPEAMMSRAELSKASRLLDRMDQLNTTSGFESPFPKIDQQQMDKLKKSRATLEQAMDILAAKVWKREVGLERYSVVHVQREDLQYKLQVLGFSFRDGRPWRDRWAWHFKGRALRKDGSLGIRPLGISFSLARLWRRHLDGQWRELRWPSEGEP